MSILSRAIAAVQTSLSEEELAELRKIEERTKPRHRRKGLDRLIARRAASGDESSEDMPAEKVH